MSVTNLIDRPVDKFDEEEPLGLSPYANALNKFIKQCETPITIGIQGDWGVGKTSLLNMTKDKLERKRGRGASYPVIYFNTWQYSQLDQEDYLTVAMLHDIVDRIGDLSPDKSSASEKAGEILQDVGSMAVNFGNQMLESKVGANAKKAWDEANNNGEGTPPFLRVMNLMVDYKDQFRDLVEEFIKDQSSGDRLVIMIDDLDRIRPARALDLLSSVKNFLDVPHCVFVLAVDRSVIQRGVEEKLGADERKRHGKSYFDKIIQVPFSMPVESYRVDRYIMSLLSWKWNEEDGEYKSDRENGDEELLMKGHRTIDRERAVEIKNMVTCTVGQNPRSIKRAVNYYGLLKRVFDENNGDDEAEDFDVAPDHDWRALYLQLLFGFSCFKLSYPELFEHFLKDPTPQRLHKLQDLDYLDGLNAIDQISHRVGDIEDVKSDISAFFDQLVDILDADEEEGWQVSADEFKPVWDVIHYTNLSGSTPGDIWDQIQEMVERFAEKANASDAKHEEIEQSLKLLKKSTWRNPLRLEAKDSGIHSFNLFWNGDPVGSITSAKTDLLRFFLEPKSTGTLAETLSDEAAGYVEDVGSDHYGHGTVRVYLRDLLELEREQKMSILKEINRAVTE